MRPLRALAVYLAVVFLGGGLIAPWLHALAQHWADAVPYLAEQPFRRYVNRSMLVLALAGMWPLLRSFGASSPREFGLVSPRGQWGRLLGGFALGFASLAVIVALTLLAGALSIRETLTPVELAGTLGEAALTAVSVAFIEELLFRGAIFNAFRRVLRWETALLLSSAIYGILHFMKRADLEGPARWYSGWVVMGQMLSGFAHWQEVFPGFLNLTLAGAMLALAYQRTGNLWFSIGLHAGWIFWRRANGALTTEGADGAVWFWGTRTMVDGWLALLILGAALALQLRLLPPHSSPQAAQPRAQTP